MSELSPSLIAELEAIVGAEHLETDAGAIDDQSRDIGPWRTRGVAIVSPATAEEVAAVVRIANRESLPLWTFSGGWNWGYGAAMGIEDGALIMLLRRMNRILEVNRELAYAVVEPGVTQAQLRAYLDEHETGLWSDSTDSTPKGSVIGNALEHGVGYTPLCDHFGTLCGLEVVLADGTIVRSGGGAENDSTFHTHRWGTGPSIDGLMGQSNLGIVTKAGVWLMPKPEEHGLFLIEIDDEEHLPPAIDAIRELTLQGIVRANIHTVNDVLFSAILGPYPYDLLEPGATRLSDAGRAKLRERHNIAPLSLTGGLYGTAAQVAEQKERLDAALSPHGKLTFVSSRVGSFLPRVIDGWERLTPGGNFDRAMRRATGASLPKLRATAHIFGLLCGVPSELVLGFAYFKAEKPRPDVDLDPARDGAGMIWAPCKLPLRGRDMRAVIDLARPLFHAHGLDYTNTFISINARTTMSLMPIFFRPSDRDEVERALALQQALFDACQRAGYPQYRTGHSLHARLFVDAPGYHKAAKAIKNALDPKGILAPGRYGI